MSVLFWAFAVIMSITAVSFVAIPLKTGRLSPGAPVTLAIAALPIAAFGLYLTIGSPGVVSAEPHSLATPTGSSAGTALDSEAGNSIGTVDSLLGGLKARLEADPDDAGSWLLLARSYDHLGRNEDAIAAYMTAQALGKTDPAFETSLLGAALADAREGQRQ